MKLFNPDEDVKENQENPHVIEHFYRFRSGEMLEKAKELSDANKFEEAQKLLQEMITKL